MYAIYPPIFYVLGRYLMDKWFEYKFLILIFLILSFSLPMIIETINDIFLNGFINLSRGLDLSERNDVAATLIGAKVSLAVTSIGLVFVKADNLYEKRIRLLLLILGFLSLLVTVHLINRTGLVLSFISIVFIVLLNFKNYKKSNILIGLILIVILGFLIYPVLDKYDAIDAYASREEITDYETKSAGGRTARWVEGIDYIVANPLGGGVYLGGARYYAHNLWLDVGEMAGIIPMVLLIVVTILNLKKSAELVFKNNNLSFFFKSLIGTINIGFFLTCFVEPMYEGNFIYVCAYFSFWGMISIIYNKENFKFSDIQNEN
jgi:O-antigen ligase